MRAIDTGSATPADLQAQFQPRRPLDLGVTLAPIGQGPWLRLGDGEVWRATQTPEGAATIHLLASNGVVHVDAWGPGAGWAGAVGHDPTTIRCRTRS